MSSNKPLELVRVKDPNTGAESRMSRAHAKRAGFTVLDKPVRDGYGRLIPTKTDPLRREDDEVQVIDVAPSESATHADIDAYAAARGIDLTGAGTKSDKLAAIAAADTKES